MPKTRNCCIAEFKKRVVLAALKEDKTPAQLASEFGVGGDLISVWKKQALDGMEAIFELGKEASKTKELEHDKERLFQQVGKLSYELDRLKKNVDMDFNERCRCIESDNKKLSVRRQCSTVVR